MLELIFFHLPKTGGSSILKTLNHVYGEEYVRHFERDECLDLNNRGIKISNIIGPEIKVIHGHFRYKEVKDLVKRDNPKLVSFFREPVSRVISNYYWWKHSLSDKPEHPSYHLRNQELRSYIKGKVTQNKMSYFLKGASLKNFAFIGFLDQFDEDLKKMGDIFNWPATPSFHEKKASTFKRENDVSQTDELLKAIIRLNKKDMKLYKMALDQSKAQRND